MIRLGMKVMTMALLCTVMAASADLGEAIMFPKAEGSNLEGKTFVLPDDFEGELNLVLVAFQREQQADVDTWLEPASSPNPPIRSGQRRSERCECS